MPHGFPSAQPQTVAKNPNVLNALGSFRYQPGAHILQELLGQSNTVDIDALQAQLRLHTASIATGVNEYWEEGYYMSPLARTTHVCWLIERVWWRQTVAETIRLLLRQGTRRKVLAMEGSEKPILHGAHFCINDRSVSTAATAFYGKDLKHAEIGIMIIDEVRESIRLDLVHAVKGGSESFPSIDLAIRAFTLLPDGSFNSVAFEQLKRALSLKDVDQLANYVGRYASAS